MRAKNTNKDNPQYIKVTLVFSINVPKICKYFEQIHNYEKHYEY